MHTLGNYYYRHTQPWILRDGDNHKELLFHIEADDYFATLATVLELLRQTLADPRLQDESHQHEIKLALARIAEDLLFLQKNYQIKKR